MRGRGVSGVNQGGLAQTADMQLSFKLGRTNGPHGISSLAAHTPHARGLLACPPQSIAHHLRTHTAISTALLAHSTAHRNPPLVLSQHQVLHHACDVVMRAPRGQHTCRCCSPLTLGDLMPTSPVCCASQGVLFNGHVIEGAFGTPSTTHLCGHRHATPCGQIAQKQCSNQMCSIQSSNALRYATLRSCTLRRRIC
jgi:hypothetical protein